MGRYHKNIKVEGSDEFELAVNIAGHGAPTESTEAELGMLYMDIDSADGDLYKCTGKIIADGKTTYTWKKMDHYTKAETDKKLAEKAPGTMRVYNEYGTTDYTSEEIIEHLQNGGCTILDDVDLGGFPYLWSYAGTVFYGGIIPHIDKYIYICFAVSGNTATTVMFDMAEYVKLSDLEPVLKAFSDRFDDHYTKAEIDTMLGSYVNDIAELIGGEAIADS